MKSLFIFLLALNSYAAPLFKSFTYIAQAPGHQVGSLESAPINSKDILKKILEALSDRYFDIGNERAQAILELLRSSDLKKFNYRGFSWSRPFGSVLVQVNRQLAPDLFDDERFIISDTMEITVDAQPFLRELKEEGIIDYTKKQFEAYAGITYKRNYRYVHFADNFTKALTADYTKLFLPFLVFSGTNFLAMGPYEIATKKDFFSFKAGGILTGPINPGLSGGGGVLAQLKKISQVDIQHLGPNDNPLPDEFMRLSMEKEVGAEAHVSAQLNGDFYTLLGMTLFQLDMAYEYKEAQATYLSFKNIDKPILREKGAKYRELRSIIRLKKTPIVELASHVVQHQLRVSQKLSAHYGVLVWGAKTLRESEQIQIIDDEIQRDFTRFNMRSYTYREGLIDNPVSIVMNSLFDTDNELTQYHTSRSERLIVEFENHSDKKEVSRGDETLSIVLAQEYKTRQKFAWSRHPHRRRALDFATRYTTLDEQIIQKLKTNQLKAPLSLFSNIRVEKDGLAHFHGLKKSEVYRHIDSLCESEKSKSKVTFCRKKIKGQFRAYLETYQTTKLIDAKKLKAFLYSIHKRIDELSQWYPLFGKENLFINGSLMAHDREGELFLTYFKSGIFRGLGVIKNALSSKGVISPIPVVD